MHLFGIITLVVAFSVPAWAFGPCSSPRQVARDVQATRNYEAGIRALFLAGKFALRAGQVPVDRDATLATEYAAKLALATQCDNAVPASSP